MTERLLRRADIAAMLGTSPGVAASVLVKYGVHPIDFGYGRGRGARWLESAVRQALIEMHQNAQPELKPEREKRPARSKHFIAEMSVNDIYRLTHGQCVQ